MRVLKKWLFWPLCCGTLLAAPAANPQLFDLNQLAGTVQFSQNITLMLTLAFVSLLPFFLMSTTSFLRIVIVLGFVRSAIGTQQTPPSSVIISIAFFLTMYVMTPVWQEIQTTALEPYNQGRITQQMAWENGLKPLKNFMIRQTREKDLVLFIEFSKIPPLTDINDVPIYVLMPAFILSEMSTAFKIAFVIFVPFVVVDMVVSNVLLSLGMFMLSPVMISLPFKILLFVLADGWFLITRGLIQSFV
ncbi:flagellar biosynthetic protein FliP [Candidatus Termititenax persephonae]|uniref:Flagellar biosynthetic protein FliP n=1 Tax=Candidatus Termititenax persephonae TaxID=2218525 RepID=A0A388TI63_9BACT|nr:flagellar biosynthetic protein FliP [Candidatus Termititenax persephonae]